MQHEIGRATNVTAGHPLLPHPYTSSIGVYGEAEWDAAGGDATGADAADEETETATEDVVAGAGAAVGLQL